MIYDIKPCPKPRMTAAVATQKTSSALRYWAFVEEVKLKSVKFENGQSITFHIPIARSASKRTRAAFDKVAHRQTPDADNLVKALFDALYKNDSHIWHFTVKKVWTAGPGCIEIK